VTGRSGMPCSKEGSARDFAKTELRASDTGVGISVGSVRTMYLKWCRRSTREPCSSRVLNKEIWRETRGEQVVALVAGKTTRIWRGIEWADPRVAGCLEWVKETCRDGYGAWRDAGSAV